MTGDNHDGGVRACFAQLFECFETVDSGKPDIEQDAAIGATSERLKTLFAGGDGVGDEALVLHHCTEGVANAALVVNDKNRVHF